MTNSIANLSCFSISLVHKGRGVQNWVDISIKEHRAKRKIMITRWCKCFWQDYKVILIEAMVAWLAMGHLDWLIWLWYYKVILIGAMDTWMAVRHLDWLNELLDYKVILTEAMDAWLVVGHLDWLWEISNINKSICWLGAIWTIFVAILIKDHLIEAMDTWLAVRLFHRTIR